MLSPSASARRASLPGSGAANWPFSIRETVAKFIPACSASCPDEASEPQCLFWFHDIEVLRLAVLILPQSLRVCNGSWIIPQRLVTIVIYLFFFFTVALMNLGRTMISHHPPAI